MLLVGIDIGLCVGFIFAFWRFYSYRKILVLKSEKANRTSEKIGDNFYYIVPADEYIEMEQVWLFKKYDEMKESEMGINEKSK